MADLGHQITDAELKKLEKRIAAEYKTAVKDMQRKLTDYLTQTESARQVQEKLWKAGKITKQDYQNWCLRHEMVGKRWEQMKDVLAADMHHTNEIALGIAKGKMPDIYALNGNYATYRIEHDGEIDTGFTLYNHDTAEYLLKDQRQLMPGPSTRKAKEIAANKDMQWNKQHIQSAVLQGVLQGESPYDVAGRLQQVGQMNYNAAVRYARTMTTSAQNAGRYEAFHRAKRLGVDLTIEWQATLDSRTRHEHRQMHGQRREVDEPFQTPDGYTIYYPADCTGASDAPQQEIWNCRCTLLSWVKGFEGDTVKSSPKMGDMSFEEWQKEKAPKEDAAAKEQKESYQFHATRRSSLVGIAEKGLLPNRGHAGKGVYFADSVDDALEWTAETSTGGTTVLRVNEKFLGKGSFEKYAASETGYNIAESVFEGIVPLEEIEIKVNDNGDEYDWWSLSQFMKQHKRMYEQLSKKTQKKVDKIVHEELVKSLG